VGEEPDGVPPGRWLGLADQHQVFLRELPGPPGAQVVMLVHGWFATAGTNWLPVFAPLARQFRVLATDQRGHGRGMRAGRFRLRDCADDAAALMDALGVERAIVVGFSMGGPIAQLTWRQHPDRVAGLVLCATASGFLRSEQLRLLASSALPGLVQASRIADLPVRLPVRAKVVMPAFVPTKSQALAAWAARELRRHHPRALVEAAFELSTHDASGWIGEVDVPTAVVATTKDRAVDVSRQLSMAAAIPGATVHYLADGHLVLSRSIFAPAVVAACEDVAQRVVGRDHERVALQPVGEPAPT
jgi:pimeloyl-ACP methyl ester carboxylesterase